MFQQAVLHAHLTTKELSCLVLLPARARLVTVKARKRFCCCGAWWLESRRGSLRLQYLIKRFSVIYFNISDIRNPTYFSCKGWPIVLEDWFSVVTFLPSRAERSAQLSERARAEKSHGCVNRWVVVNPRSLSARKARRCGTVCVCAFPQLGVAIVCFLALSELE